MGVASRTGTGQVGYRQEQDAIDRVKLKKGQPDSEQPRKAVQDEETRYNEISNNAILELLHSDRFRPQYENINHVFSMVKGEPPTMVPIDLLKAVETREQALSAKATALQHISKAQTKRIADNEIVITKQVTSLSQLTTLSVDLQKKCTNLAVKANKDADLIQALSIELEEVKLLLEKATEGLKKSTMRNEAMESRVEDLKQENNKSLETILKQEQELTERCSQASVLRSKIEKLDEKASSDAEAMEMQAMQLATVSQRLEAIKEENEATNRRGGEKAVLKRSFIMQKEKVREERLMETFDVDMHGKQDLYTELTVDTKRKVNRITAKVMEYTAAVRKETIPLTVQDAMSQVERFITKNPEKNPVFFSLLSEMGRMSIDLAAAIGEPLSEVAGVLSFLPDSQTKQLTKVLDKRVSDLRRCVDKALTGIMRLAIENSARELSMNMRPNTKSVKVGPCGQERVVQIFHKGITAYPPVKSTASMAYVPVVSVAVGGSEGCNKGIGSAEFESMVERVAKSTREAMATSGMRATGVPVGLRVGSGRSGFSLLSSVSDGLDLLKDRLLDMLRQGKLPYEMVKDMNGPVMNDTKDQTDDTRAKLPFIKKIRELAERSKKQRERADSKDNKNVKELELSRSRKQSRPQPQPPPAPPAKERFGGFFDTPAERPRQQQQQQQQLQAKAPQKLPPISEQQKQKTMNRLAGSRANPLAPKPPS